MILKIYMFIVLWLSVYSLTDAETGKVIHCQYPSPALPSPLYEPPPPPKSSYPLCGPPSPPLPPPCQSQPSYGAPAPPPPPPSSGQPSYGIATPPPYQSYPSYAPPPPPLFRCCESPPEECPYIQGPSCCGSPPCPCWNCGMVIASSPPFTAYHAIILSVLCCIVFFGSAVPV